MRLPPAYFLMRRVAYGAGFGKPQGKLRSCFFLTYGLYYCKILRPQGDARKGRCRCDVEYCIVR